MTLAQYTSPGLIVPQLRHRQPAAVIGELCSALEREHCISDPLALYNDVMSRESLGHSAMAPGWALPHARLGGLPRLVFALGRAAEPLNWFGNSGQPVRLVFLIAVPEAEAGTHLNLVAGLARLSQDSARFNALLQAPDQQGVWEVLSQIQLRRPRPAAVCC